MDKFKIKCPRCGWDFDLDEEKHVKSDIESTRYGGQSYPDKDLVCPSCKFSQTLSYGY